MKNREYNNSENYTVKNVKSFEGREGYGFNCSLYRDGKRVAKVHDMADGGCYDFYFESEEEEARFDAMVAAFDEIESDMGNGEKWVHKPNADMFLSHLVEEFETLKWAKRQCRKQTLFKLKGDEENKWRVIGSEFCDALKAALVKKFGDKLDVILNEKIAA